MPEDLRPLSQAAIGIGVVALGFKMFLESKNVLIPIGSLILGVIVGHLLRIQAGIDILGSFAERKFGGGSGFQESFVTSTILFCVGPMTLLGCLEDGLQGETRLLSVKSILDGVSSVFIAATVGMGVFLSALSVFIIQGGLTLGAKQFTGLSKRTDILAEVSAAGGLILPLIGLNLLGVLKLPTADFVPAILFAGLFTHYFGKAKEPAP